MSRPLTMSKWQKRCKSVGRPSVLGAEHDPDWAPSVNLDVPGQCQTDRKRKRCQSHSPSSTRMSSVSCQTDVVNDVMVIDVGVQCDLDHSLKSAHTEIQPPVKIHSQSGPEVQSPAQHQSPVLSSQISSQITNASSQTSDVSYLPSHSDNEFDSKLAVTPSQDRKFLVFERSLDGLFKICPVCGHSCSLQKHVIGSYISVIQICSDCDLRRCWASQPMIGNIPAGNIQLSAAVYFSGASFAKVERVLTALNVEGISSSTYYRHAELYLQPTVLTFWRSHQSELIEQLIQRTGDVILGGDMRADSPGHCAKYGSYTLLDVRSNRIVDIQLVQSNEVGGSSHMEKEGLARSLKLLKDRGLSVDTMITDRHPQIQKYIREKMPSITHYYDVWHTAKGLSKKLEALGNERECTSARDWAKSIVNHLYWSAASSTNGDEAVAKWTSVVNHIQNVHEHDSWLFPTCQHGDLDANHSKKWIQPCSKVSVRLEAIIRSKQLLKDVAKLSPHHQTSSIEAFHSLLLKFAPKNLVFSYKSMLCRLLLAALHYNENANRPYRRNEANEPIYHVRFPKFKKGGYTAMRIKDAPTYNYVDELLSLLFTSVLLDPVHYQQLHGDIVVPPALCSNYQRPTAADVAHIKSRFNLSVKS